MMDKELFRPEILLSLMFKMRRGVKDQTVVGLLYKMKRAATLSGLSDLNEFVYRCGINQGSFSDEEYGEAITCIDKHLDAQVWIYDINSSLYPDCLRKIRNPPPLIYVKGDGAAITKTPGVAIVGARDCSDAGRIISYRISKELSGLGWTVVSGLALGIDAAAHQGAMVGGSPTLAVLASGLHAATPRANAKIADEILDHGGAWISEHPLGTPPKRTHFVPRNRIQMGLSAGSIIVEAMKMSGSMAQARLCREQSRYLFPVIPHDGEVNSLGLVCEGTLILASQNDKVTFPIRSKNDYSLIAEKLASKKKELAPGSL